MLVCSAIVLARSTNLNVLKDYLPQLLANQVTKPASHYKRLIRFFRFEKPNQLVTGILQFIFRFFEGHFTYLIMDATTWQIGQKSVHLLTLCILFGDTAIPIYWLQLDKKGHSSEIERKQLIAQALRLYKLAGKILLADREYIGEKWLRYLVESDIHFVIRLPEACYKIPIGQAPGPAFSKLCRQAHNRKHGVIKSFILNECCLSTVILKNPKNDPKEPFLHFVSSLTNKHKIAQAYRLRWRIETCFKQFKSQGFNIEDLNLKDNGKIMLLVAIVVMAYVLSLQTVFEEASEKVKVYRDGNQKLAISYFRQGITRLRRVVQSLAMFMEHLELIIWDHYWPEWLYVQ